MALDPTLSPDVVRPGAAGPVELERLQYSQAPTARASSTCQATVVTSNRRDGRAVGEGTVESRVESWLVMAVKMEGRAPDWRARPLRSRLYRGPSR
jgi:hypothetical protein